MDNNPSSGTAKRTECPKCSTPTISHDGFPVLCTQCAGAVALKPETTRCKLCDGVLPVNSKVIVLASGTPAEIGPICLPCANALINALAAVAELYFQCSYCGVAISVGNGEDLKEAARAHDEACSKSPLHQARKTIKHLEHLLTEARARAKFSVKDILAIIESLKTFLTSAGELSFFPGTNDELETTISEATKTMQVFLKKSRELLLDNSSTKD